MTTGDPRPIGDLVPMTTPPTPAMTAQEALAAMDQPEWGTPEDVEAVRAALSDAERRATEAGERIASLSRNLMDHERELSAVEARLVDAERRATEAEAEPLVAPVYPAAGWSLKPVGPDEVPRLVADIVARPGNGVDPVTRDLFYRAIDVLCRVEDARREAAAPTVPLSRSGDSACYER